ncbi:MAG: ABC transporter permease [Planctomycetia bacterium]|nr:ABC transporter permease [Planctomycetia bacterium]
MRWHIFTTLLHKELLRHLANRGGIVLAFLLAGIALLLSLWKSGNQGPLLGGEVQRCYIVYEKDDPNRAEVKRWLTHLRENQPADWTEGQLRIRPIDQFPTDQFGRIIPAANAGTFIVRSQAQQSEGQPPRYEVTFWYPGPNSTAVASYEAWFWKETRNHFQQQPYIDAKHERLEGSADLSSVLAMALVFFGLFFSCVYLLPSMTCEERERGVLLAQALSPASPLEILAAKFFFYPLAGMLLSVVLGGIYRPAVLLLPFFWCAIFVGAIGSMGIGMTIATLARTQRLASVGAMCYLLILALFMVTIQLNSIPILAELVLETHTTKIFHAALSGVVTGESWLRLVAAGFLSVGWAILATVLFRRRGWQ